MGRFWQTLILKEWNALFAYVPIVTLVRDNQEAYYHALNESNRCGKSTPFIEFILKTVETALGKVQNDQVNDQVKEFLTVMGRREVSVSYCMEKLGMKHRPSFRKNRLNPSIEVGLVEMTQPDSPHSPLQKYRLTVKGRTVL